MENEQTISLASTASAVYDGFLGSFKTFCFRFTTLGTQSQILVCGWIGAKKNQL